MKRKKKRGTFRKSTLKVLQYSVAVNEAEKLMSCCVLFYFLWCFGFYVFFFGIAFFETSPPPPPNVPPQKVSFYSKIRIYIILTGILYLDKIVYVVPAFESEDEVPVGTNKEALINLWDTGKVQPFYYKACEKCQHPTNYYKWKRY